LAKRAAFLIPGPRPHLILGRPGNILQLLRDPIGVMDRLFEGYGPVVALVANGGTHFYSPLPDCPGTVFAYGPEIMRQVATQLDNGGRAFLPRTVRNTDGTGG
jgi:hypothetical protein